MTGHRVNSSNGMNTAFPVDGWRSANRCGPDGGNCVEVNLAARDTTGAIDIVGIRDSKPVAGPELVFDVPGWRSFLAATIMDNMHAAPPTSWSTVFQSTTD